MMQTLRRFVEHPVMGVYAILLLSVIVVSMGLGILGYMQAARFISEFATVGIVFGFAALAVADFRRQPPGNRRAR